MATTFLINTETQSGQIAVQMRLGNSLKTNRTIDSIEWEIASNFISHQSYATRKTMTKYSHRWILSNSKTTDNNMICPYCYRSKETLDHDHFLTCNESDVRK